MRILFWGTPDFSVPALQALLGEDHEVVAVVTQPDRPAGRGREIREPPVKTIAQGERIPVLQPDKARDPGFVAEVRDLAPEISVVVAYGQILTQEVLAIPPYGSINAHASLLPELRGAAPINWSIVRGYEMTGVTIMRMVEQMDAGPVLYQVAEPIGADETASDLWTRLSEIGAEALIETLALIETGAVEEQPQDETHATYAPRIHRADAHIDFSQSATTVANLIRGMDAVPGAWTTLRRQELKLYRPQVHARDHGEAPGTILDATQIDPSAGIVVACGQDAVAIREVQPAGKRRMMTVEWLRGHGSVTGERLSGR